MLDPLTYILHKHLTTSHRGTRHTAVEESSTSNRNSPDIIHVFTYYRRTCNPLIRSMEFDFLLDIDLRRDPFMRCC